MPEGFFFPEFSPNICHVFVEGKQGPLSPNTGLLRLFLWEGAPVTKVAFLKERASEEV